MMKYIFLFIAIFLMLPLQAQNGTQNSPNPIDYLDAPLPEKATGKALKIEVGANNFGATYQNYSIHSMLQMIVNNNLFNDNDLKDSINYLLNVWPPANEMIALEQPTVYQQKTTQGGSFVVNESGRLISQDDVNGNSAYQTDLNATETVTGRRLSAVGGWFSNSEVNAYNAGTATAQKRKEMDDLIASSVQSFSQSKGLSQSFKYANTVIYPNRGSAYPLGMNASQVGVAYNSITITTSSKKYVLEEALVCSPIVLDLDGDGKIEASNGVWLPHGYNNARVAEFDMDGDGLVDLTEWVGPNDGILMVATGNEVSGRNFFGDIDGFVNGYQKLSTLDSNNDKQLVDSELSTLSVWQDKNGNAKIDKGEVKSVAELGITSIRLTYDSEFVSSFVQNGQVKKMWDWYPCILRLKRTK